MSKFASLIGTHLLPFTNPRVVSPPGGVVSKGRINIIVATPMRSGTHILIDLILNNIPAYRNRPLYVDLDQCAKQSQKARDLLSPITPDLGYILKTHMPIGTPPNMADDPRIAKLLEKSCILTIHRTKEDVCRSLGHWHGIDQSEAEAKYGADYDHFWNYWKGLSQIEIDFPELFQPIRVKSLLEELAVRTGTSSQRDFVGVPSKENQRSIYAHKTMTRLFGNRAPKINTTIHTLKTN